jgi:hypothetical protein
VPKADHIEVERVGGFAGFGGPGAHLRSRGHVELAKLSDGDRRAVDALFHARAAAPASGADGFRYRLTRNVTGRPESIEVASAALPAALRDCVRDELV